MGGKGEDFMVFDFFAKRFPYRCVGGGQLKEKTKL